MGCVLEATGRKGHLNRRVTGLGLLQQDSSGLGCSDQNREGPAGATQGAANDGGKASLMGRVFHLGSFPVHLTGLTHVYEVIFY